MQPKKYAAKNGNINALRKFKTDFLKLSKTTVELSRKNITKSWAATQNRSLKDHNANANILEKQADLYY